MINARMVVGEKKTFTAPENSFRSSNPWNSCVSRRHLHKSDLGGMVFGCKHYTMAECLSKRLFGLPAFHYSYVRNVEPSLPLFLFNYDDRKLHGIFEATSHGDMNIDPYAWTDGVGKRSPFPAQVRIRIKVQCEPVLENQFRKIIEGNYYRGQHFWFELDNTQTRGLMTLFRPSPTNLIPTTVTKKRGSPLASLTMNSWKTIGSKGRVDIEGAKPKRNSNASFDLVNLNMFASLECDDEESDRESENIVVKEPVSDLAESGKDFVDRTSLPMTNWKTIVSKGRVETEGAKPQKNYNASFDLVNLNMLESLECDDKDIDHGNSSKMSFSATEDTVVKEPLSDLEESGKDFVDTIQLDTTSNLNAGDQTQPIQEDANVGFQNGVKEVLTKLQMPSANHDPLYSSSMCRENDLVISLAKTDLNEFTGKLSVETTMLTEDNVTLDHHQGNEEVESDRKIQQLNDLVKHSERKIEQLEEHLKELESMVDPSVDLDDLMKEFVDQYIGSDKMIYLVGGFDGESWMSALDSLSPSLDVLTPLKSMMYARQYASAVALHGRIYVFGGGEFGGENSCHKTVVECYNTNYDEWAICAPMRCGKANLSGATLNGKIFAIGGGTRHVCYSDVQMFDPALERWFNTQPMIEKRLALATAELHGALYAVGGYNGKSYLESAEKYDPREPYWTRLPNLISKRACHSLEVFNEKLYAIGGYDGQKMVSSVEIFDPRMDSWMMGDPMKFERGYAASVVLDNSLLVIGGLIDGDNFIENVESYNERTGWTIENMKSIKKRCFFSAIIL
ncbi:hypothetical protein J5N97_017468 [Dioscorea zingiberensis]|uniref:DCD domain-containing protein n=1 Tax=Dioscorea zingiberensis TaxID=325984 RepID=A0A9D5CN97_9LILI|nr:hypothetical protein J5N97_017468 [Dioscorea zingiberensis]